MPRGMRVTNYSVDGRIQGARSFVGGLDDTDITDAVPSARAYTILRPGEALSTRSSFGILYFTEDATADAGPFPRAGRHLLEFVLSPVYRPNQDVEELSERWEEFGLLLTQDLRSEVMSFEIETDPIYSNEYPCVGEPPE